MAPAMKCVWLLWLGCLLAVQGLVSVQSITSAATGKNGQASAKGSFFEAKEPTIWRRPVMLFLGDSITELGADHSTGGWTARLSTAYVRKADILNRGFSGYNTNVAKLSLPEIVDGVSKQQVVLGVIWLGANDAALLDGLDGRAHVPLDTYTSNLQSLVQMMQSAGVQQVLLVTPPPVWEDAPQARNPGEKNYRRTNVVTATYAAAVRSLAGKLSLPLLDVWALFNSFGDWQNKLLNPDGLHLSPQGQEVIFNGLTALIEQQLPQLKPASLPWHHPTWWFLDYANATKVFSAERSAYLGAFGIKP